jgi:hypothetical protein
MVLVGETKGTIEKLDKFFTAFTFFIHDCLISCRPKDIYFAADVTGVG